MITSIRANRRSIFKGAMATTAGLALARHGALAKSTPEATVTLAAGEAAWPMYNVNLASDEQLLALPGVGDQMLDEFREYAPFTSVTHFVTEIGKYVDEETTAGYFDWLFVPIDVAALDEASLMQLPGMDEEKAATLAGGTYADGDAFLAALAEHVSPQQATLAAAYLADRATAIATWVMYDLNSATAEQFATIPGVGDQMLDEFDEYKPYTSIEQFSAEIGKYVDADILAVYLDYVFVPVTVNDATEADLFQLPGVDEDDVATLIAGQPFADNAAFLAALAPLVTAEYAAAAADYLVE